MWSLSFKSQDAISPISAIITYNDRLHENRLYFYEALKLCPELGGCY